MTEPGCGAVLPGPAIGVCVAVATSQGRDHSKLGDEDPDEELHSERGRRPTGRARANASGGGVGLRLTDSC